MRCSERARLLVEGATAHGEFVRYAVSLNDVQHFVAFLLVSVGKISAVQRYEGKPDAEVSGPAGRKIYMLSRDLEQKWLDMHARETGVKAPVD
jgi:hypothetical protein